MKRDNTIRICGDFKLTLNPHVITNKSPLLRIEDVFAALQGGEKFTELDLTHAYMQIPVRESSQEYLTITTHLGLYRYTKMPEGVFQSKMEDCIRGVRKAIPYLDNIYVTGADDAEHMQNLKEVSKRLEPSGLRVRTDKCKIMQEKIELLGFTIDKNGLHKSKNKVKAMVDAPRPRNTKQLLSLLGLINFYGHFLNHRSDKLKPLYDCANNKDFFWPKNASKLLTRSKNLFLFAFSHITTTKNS